MLSIKDNYTKDTKAKLEKDKKSLRQKDRILRKYKILWQNGTITRGH